MRRVLVVWCALSAPLLGCDREEVVGAPNGAICKTDQECASDRCRPGRTPGSDKVCCGGTGDDFCCDDVDSVCADGNPCTIDACSEFICSNTPVDPGTECADSACAAEQFTPAGLCDDAGSCVAAPIESCDGYVCEPGGDACKTKCGAAKDCASAYFCELPEPGVGLAPGQCLPGCLDAKDCDDSLDCTVGECNDAVCSQQIDAGWCVVDSTCYAAGQPADACLECSPDDDPEAFTSASTDKQCAPASCADAVQTPARLCDGQGECAPAAAESCPDDADDCTVPECVEGACGYSIAEGASCGPVSCSTSNELVAAGICAATGSCTPGAASPCDPYVCDSDADACPTSCDADLECIGGHACIGGLCAPKACVDDAGCDDSNDCTKDVCNLGTYACENPADVDLVCAPSVCSGNQFTGQSICSALGTCESQAALDCGDYICNEEGCKTQCAVDADCSDPQTFCAAGACLIKECTEATQAVDCDDQLECTTGTCGADFTCSNLIEADRCLIDDACYEADDLQADTVCLVCDPTAPTQWSDVAGGTVCKAAACDGAQYTPAGTCQEGACVDSSAVACLDEDDNPCTAAGCDAETGCVSVDVTEGTLCGVASCAGAAFTKAGECNGTGSCVQATGNCNPYVCGETACLSACVGPSDCVAGFKCDDGECVAGCVTTDDCPDDANGCTGVACNAASKQCEYPPATGTQCQAAACAGNEFIGAATCSAEGVCGAVAPTNCGDFLCDSGGCKTQCVVDADCADSKNYCAAGACVVKKCTPATQAVDCDDQLECTIDACDAAFTCSNLIEADRCLIDGTCYDADDLKADSVCLVCDPTAPTQWSDAAGGTVCGTAACNGPQYTPAGTCQAGACVAASAVTCPDEDDNPCTAAGCDAGTGCISVDVSQGTLCGADSCAEAAFTKAGECNGAGTCVQATGGCSPYVCGPTACLSACVGPSDCVAGFKCESGECVAGCVTTDDCPDDANGCTGVICNAASKQCEYPPTVGTLCGPAACVGNEFTGEATCTAEGVCGAVVPTNCGDFVCDDAGCKTQCVVHSDCADSKNFCSAGACVPKECTQANQAETCDDQLSCTTDTCDVSSFTCSNAIDAEQCVVDGACYASGDAQDEDACQVCVPAQPEQWSNAQDGALCQAAACSGAEYTPASTCSAGKCALATGVACAEDAGNPCTAAACDPVVGCGIADIPAGTPCGQDSCVGGSYTKLGQCDGGGTCLEETGDCGFYVCGGSACKSSCDVAADCAPGYQCDGGACVVGCITAADCPDDGKACTSVACNAASKKCEYPLLAAWCDIGGNCYADAATNPANPCQTCDALSPGQWTSEEAGTACGAQSCTGSTFTPQALCDAAGACEPATPESCGGSLVCNADTCFTACADAADCVDGHGCVGAACVPLVADGVACTADGMCDSGHCDSGICCTGGTCCVADGDCADALVCTDDLCTANVCGNPNNVAACDTTATPCGQGLCAAGSCEPLACGITGVRLSMPSARIGNPTPNATGIDLRGSAGQGTWVGRATSSAVTIHFGYHAQQESKNP